MKDVSEDDGEDGGGGEVDDDDGDEGSDEVVGRPSLFPSTFLSWTFLMLKT